MTTPKDPMLTTAFRLISLPFDLHFHMSDDDYPCDNDLILAVDDETAFDGGLKCKFLLG